MTVGLIALAYAPSFAFALGAISVVGMASAFGESVTLGYLRLFPSELVNGWSSGTGMAGIAGAALYVLYSGVELTNRQAFLFTIPR